MKSQVMVIHLGFLISWRMVTQITRAQLFYDSTQISHTSYIFCHNRKWNPT